MVVEFQVNGAKAIGSQKFLEGEKDVFAMFLVLVLLCISFPHYVLYKLLIQENSHS